MPYDITKYEPGYGGLINSAGEVVNQADGLTTTGARLQANDVIAVTMQNAATATANGTSLNTANQAMAVLDVQGTFVGTITIRATIDGTNYFTVSTTSLNTETRANTITAPGQYSLRVAGYRNIIAQITTYTSGSITVYGRAVSGGSTHHTSAITNTPTVLQGGVDQTSAFKNYTLQVAATATGNGTFADVTGYSALTLTCLITGTATITFEGSNDSTFPANATAQLIGRTSQSTGNALSTQSATGVVFINVSAVRYVRARISAYTSGTVDVTGVAELGAINWYPTTAGYGASDALPATSSLQGVGSYNLLYNGSTWDRARNNQYVQLIASGARTSTTSSSQLTNFNFRGISVNLSITVASGTGGLQIAIQGYDQSSASYKTLHTLATAITATGLYVVQMYPSIDNVNSAITQTISQALPAQYRVQVIHGDASSYTYSLSVNYIL